MARRPLTQQERVQLGLISHEGEPAMEARASIDLGEFSRRKAKPRPMARRELDKILEETRALMGEQAWMKFDNRHFVGMYALLHENAYGILPLDLLGAGVHRQACLAASRLTNQMGKKGMVEFLRWTWQRELKAFPGRQTDWRIGWRYQFTSQALQTDFRVHVNKQKRR